MTYISWIFLKKNVFIRVIFILCAILLDLFTLISHIAIGIEIEPLFWYILLTINIFSSITTILNMFFSIVPDVTGLKIKDAILFLEREKLKYSLIVDDNVVVVKQCPVSNTIVFRGTKVKLTVGKFINNEEFKIVNVAMDNIPKNLIREWQQNIATAGDATTNNKRMIIENSDGSETTVEVVLSFEFTDSHDHFIVYCDGKFSDGTPKLYFARLDNGSLAEINDMDWKRIRTLIRYVTGDKEPLREERYNSKGVEELY